MPHDRKENSYASTTVSIAVTALLRALSRAWAWLTHLACRTAHAVSHGAQRAGTRTAVFISTAVRRLLHRWRTDTTYRRTLLAALTATVSILLPHPAAAAVIGALVAERPSYRVDPYLDDDEDDYVPRRPPLDPWAPSPRRLWDTFE